jgi:poly-gamma-glutamate capsule biosynthesis protein CapA/YwtB (metallophosphatase superfamily)
MDNSFKIAFLGDISLNGGYKEIALQGRNPFNAIEHLLNKADFVVGNLEAVCGHKEGKHHPKQTRLSIAPESLSLLKYLNLNLVTLANNHIFDNLDDGLMTALKYLDKNGIDYTGASLQSKSHLPYVLEKNGIKIAFLNYVHSSTHPGIDESHPVTVNHYNCDEIKSTIRQFKASCDLVVLILHWGMSNSRFPEPWQRKDARKFVNAGADLIVGHHSHVLQGYEKIGNTMVFYNLGNFAFAPYHAGKEYALAPGRQTETVILCWKIMESGNAVSWKPVRLEGLDVKPATNSKIRKLSRLIPFISNPVSWIFYKFYLNVLFKGYYYFFGHGRNPLRQLKKIDRSRLIRAKKLIGF